MTEQNYHVVSVNDEGYTHIQTSDKSALGRMVQDLINEGATIVAVGAHKEPVFIPAGAKRTADATIAVWGWPYLVSQRVEEEISNVRTIT